jgi:hypothetical protein
MKFEMVYRQGAGLVYEKGSGGISVDTTAFLGEVLFSLSRNIRE